MVGRFHIQIKISYLSFKGWESWKQWTHTSTWQQKAGQRMLPFDGACTLTAMAPTQPAPLICYVSGLCENLKL